MGFISEVTYINQNMHVPSAVMADAVAREHLHTELQRLIDKEKEEKTKEVRKIEDLSDVSSNFDKQKEEEMPEFKKNNRNHIDLKG